MATRYQIGQIGKDQTEIDKPQRPWEYLIWTANEERDRYWSINGAWTKFFSQVCKGVSKTTTWKNKCMSCTSIYKNLTTWQGIYWNKVYNLHFAMSKLSKNSLLFVFYFRGTTETMTKKSIIFMRIHFISFNCLGRLSFNNWRVSTRRSTNWWSSHSLIPGEQYQPWSIIPSERNLHSHHWSYLADHLKKNQ